MNTRENSGNLNDKRSRCRILHIRNTISYHRYLCLTHRYDIISRTINTPLWFRSYLRSHNACARLSLVTRHTVQPRLSVSISLMSPCFRHNRITGAQRLLNILCGLIDDNCCGTMLLSLVCIKYLKYLLLDVSIYWTYSTIVWFTG